MRNNNLRVPKKTELPEYTEPFRTSYTFAGVQVVISTLNPSERLKFRIQLGSGYFIHLNPL